MKIFVDINRYSLVKLLIYGFLLLGLYYSTIARLTTEDWGQETYSYCWLIPPIVLFLIWIKRDELTLLPSKSSFIGLFPIGAGIVLFWLGELSATYFILYVSFWLVLVGICLLHFGWEKIKTIGFALIFMLTMFPLPNIINVNIMLKLRLISSQLGVTLIQWYGLPVSRFGNIIDLGFAQLQVVEACSGLNSLISLLVLTLLMVHFFKAHLWKRCVVVLSSVPLAILTNSLRIAVTAILHKYYGPEVAQAFFHEFSGLVIFLLCVPILLLEVKILEKLPPVERKSSSNIGGSENASSINKSAPKEGKIWPGATILQPVFIVAVILLGATLALSRGLEFRERIPARKSIAQFPLEIGEWKAIDKQKLDQKFIDELGLSDYVLLDYKNGFGNSVNFYFVYYDSQNKRKTIHSPDSCLPGGGWSFDQAGTVSIPAIPGNPETLEVKRAVMQYGRWKQIAYYWFYQRGRILSNAYQVKIYNFLDALTMQRTDGALIRLITPIYKNEKLADADARLQNFVRDILPVMEEYIPGKDIGDSS